MPLAKSGSITAFGKSVGTVFEKKKNSHQFYVRELLGDSKWVVADGQHVSLDGRLGLCLKSRQSLGCCGVDFDQSLLVLAQHRQPPDQALTHLANCLPVNLMDGRGTERAKGGGRWKM